MPKFTVLFALLCLLSAVLAAPSGTTTSGNYVRALKKARRGTSTTLASPAELAAREIYAKRQYRRNKNNKRQSQPCPAGPQPSGACTQTCPQNEIPLLDGSCSCPGLYLNLGVTPLCVSTCPAGTYPGTDSTGHAACVACSAHATTCDGNGATGCEAGYGLDPTTKTCQPCQGGALTCTTPSNALSCGTDPLLNVQLYLDPLLGVCVNACPAGTYENGSLLQCVACGVLGALTCTNNGQTATSCGAIAGVQLYLNSVTNSCIRDCPAGTYANVGLLSCLACAAGILTCSGSATHATSCGVNALGIQLTLNPILGICV